MSLQYAILGLLTESPLTGYELNTMFNGSINYFWTAQLSQIYRELGALEKKGYVTSRVVPQKGRPDKKVYSITLEGDRAFQEWLEKFPQTLSIAIRDEITLRLFFGSRLSPDELKFQLTKLIKEKQGVLKYLQALENQCQECLKDESCPEYVLFQHLTIKKGLAVFGAEVNWAEECINELDKLQNKKETKA